MKVSWRICPVEYSDEVKEHYRVLYNYELIDPRDTWVAEVPGGTLIRFLVGTAGNVVFIPTKKGTNRMPDT